MIHSILKHKQRTALKKANLYDTTIKILSNGVLGLAINLVIKDKEIDLRITILNQY